MNEAAHSPKKRAVARTRGWTKRSKRSLADFLGTFIH